MNTALAIFVKTPSLSPVKTRLAASIGRDRAVEFYTLSINAVAEMVRSLPDVTPIWAVGEEQGIADSLWSEFEAMHTGDGDLGTRQAHVYNTLLARFDRVLLIGSDAPQMTLLHIADATAALDTHEFVIGPATDGGYYLFGGKSAVDQKIWAAVTWSAPTTRGELEALLPHPCHYLSPLTDVDEATDLEKMLAELPPAPNASQQKISEWVKQILRA